MKKFVTLFAALAVTAVAAGLFSPSTANAAVVIQKNLGLIPAGGFVPFDRALNGQGAIIGPSTPFDDAWRFKVDGGLTGAAAFNVSINFALLPQQDLDFSRISIITAATLGAGGTMVGGPIVDIAVGSVSPDKKSASVSAVLLEDVKYALRLEGITEATADQGNYAGVLTNVPIPGAVWLFGSGVLGLLGVGYSRRNRAAA